MTAFDTNMHLGSLNETSKVISKHQTRIKALIVLPKTLQGKAGVFLYSFL